jgi:hypothetical protein
MAKAASLVPRLVQSKMIMKSIELRAFILRGFNPRRKKEQFCSTKTEAPKGLGATSRSSFELGIFKKEFVLRFE